MAIPISNLQPIHDNPKYPICPLHREVLSEVCDNFGLWKISCKHIACGRAGYGWTAQEAYVDFHRANALKV